MSELQLRRRILGIDLGRARIGVAVSDELGMLAHPLETIPAGSGAPRRIAQLVEEKNAERVVVGLPRHMNGSVGESAAEALAFAATFVLWARSDFGGINVIDRLLPVMHVLSLPLMTSIGLAGIHAFKRNSLFRK